MITEYKIIDGQIYRLIGSLDPVDLAPLITEYLDIKQTLLTRPNIKTAPDQETLDFYNEAVRTERDRILAAVLIRARGLYEILKPINDQGILPAEYLDGFNELEAFINNN